MTRHPIRLAAALTLAALLFCGSAAARYYIPKPHTACRAHYVRHVAKVPERRHGRLVRHHGRIVRVKQARCVYVAPKVTSAPAPAPTVQPRPAPTVTPTAPAPAVVRAGIDPSYTQDPADPLRVTWTYSAASTGQPLPDGILSLQVSEPNAAGPSGGCAMNVTAGQPGGTCTIELPSYGAWNVTVSYSGAGSTVSPSTSTDTETIEPPDITIAYHWGTDGPTSGAAVSATVAGSTAQVSVTDPNFEGATSLPVTDDLGDSCTAQVSGTTASCSMPVSGTPSSFTLHYPGGVSTSAQQATPDNGVHTVTSTWPADTVNVTNPSVTVQTATVKWNGWSAMGHSGTGDPTDPLQVAPDAQVNLFAYASGSLASDPFPQGYITFTVTTPAGAVYTEANEYYGSSDCSESYNYPGQAVGGCSYRFTTTGTYTVTASFTDSDGQYGPAHGWTETIWVY